MQSMSRTLHLENRPGLRLNTIQHERNQSFEEKYQIVKNAQRRTLLKSVESRIYRSIEVGISKFLLLKHETSLLKLDKYLVMVEFSLSKVEI